MSVATVAKPTEIVQCDICGIEITDEEMNDGEAHGQLVGTYAGAGFEPVVLPDHKVLNFTWPSLSRKVKRRQQLTEETGEPYPTDPLYERDRHYDFHSECLAGLLDAAVDMRAEREAKAWKVAETIEKRNAKIIAEAERARAKS